MKEFFVTAKWQMKLPAVVNGVAGGVIMPSSIPYHTLGRRSLERTYPHLKRRLLDPQLYLAELNPASCRKTCANLSSYGWFDLTEQFPFDSSEHTQSEWRKKVAERIETAWTGKVPNNAYDIDNCIRRCLLVQQQVGVEAFILPGLLTQDINSDFTGELEWIERGLGVARELAHDLPVYVTIAVSDVALRGPDSWSNPLLDAILDQLTAREIRGAYIVPIMASEDSYYFTHPNTVGAILRLCNGLRAGGVSRIMVSYAGTAGLLCLAAGATAWTTGWHRSERRMRLSDFELQEGRVVPAYYSHPLAGEFHLERDLDHANQEGFLNRIEDGSVVSEGLLKALAGARQVSSVPEWQHRLGNKTASIEHFLVACSRETRVCAQLDEPAQLDRTHEWIAAAYALSADLQRIGPFNPRTSVSHQHGWLRAFERLVEEKY